MKKTAEILGLPIISISDGMEVGKVKTIIINAEKGAIDYIIVDSGIQILGAKVISSDSVLGIGEYAMTIENENVISDISKIPAAIDLLQKNIQVKGTRVLTKKGRLIGETGDIYIDEDDLCKITGLEFVSNNSQNRIRLIPRENVITFGKNLIVVTEDVEKALVDSPSKLVSSAVVYNIPSKKEPVVTDFEYSQLLGDGIKEERGSTNTTEDGDISDEPEENADYDYFKQFGKEDNEKETINKSKEEYESGEEPGQEDKETSEEKEDDTLINIDDLLSPATKKQSPENPDIVSQKTAPHENSTVDLFEQRQRQYLNGRRATKTITDNMGNIIVRDGMIIDEEVIESAKQNGKLIELVMNNRA